MVRPRQVTDDEITEATRQVFIERGPQTAVADVARRLGVSAAALFQRVGSKQALMLRALAPSPMPGLSELAQGPHEEPSARTQLIRHLQALSAFFATLLPSLIVLRVAGLFPPKGRRKRAAPAPLELRRQLAGFLARAVDQGRLDMRDPSACAEALLGALEARAFNRHVGGDAYVEGTDNAFIEGLVDGLVTDCEQKGARSGAGRKKKVPR